MVDEITEKVDAMPKKVAQMLEGRFANMPGNNPEAPEMVSDKIIPDGEAVKAKKARVHQDGNEITPPENPKEAWTMNNQQGATLRSPSPSAQATAQALAEVSQALAMAAQNWDENCYSHIGAPGHGALRNAGAARFGPLHPGLVSQHVTQVPNNQFMSSPMQRGRMMQGNAQGMMSPPGMMNATAPGMMMNSPGNAQGMMNPHGNPQAMITPNQQADIVHQQQMPNVPAHTQDTGQQHPPQGAGQTMPPQQRGNNPMPGGGRGRRDNVNMSVV